MTKTLAAMLDDRNNKADKNSFVNGHPTWGDDVSCKRSIHPTSAVEVLLCQPQKRFMLVCEEFYIDTFEINAADTLNVSRP